MAKKAAKKAKTPPKSSGTPAENSVDSPRLPAVEIVPIESLEFDPRNARKHDARDLAVTGASLDRFGQVEPLIVWRNVVIAGNGRLQHMRAKGTTHAEIRRMDHLTEAEARELAVRLNRSGTLAGWNEEILLETLREIESSGVDLSAALAYDRAELDALTNAALQSAERSLGTDDSPMPVSEDGGDDPAETAPRTSATPGDPPKDQFRILITCRDEGHQAELIDRFDAEGLTFRAQTL